MRYEASDKSQELFFNSFSEIIAILKAMGHPNRFKILVLLLKGPLSFQEILDSMNLQKSALANHLTHLKEKELTEKVKHGTYKITDDGKSYMQSIEAAYRESYSGQVKQTKEPFDTKTYCHCSVGWYNQLFESALGEPVDVELVQSIVCGADTCEFIIHLKR